MRPVKFLQFADVHLDTPFSSLSKGKREERRAELRTTFKEILHIAKEQEVDLVLIPGDLFEHENVKRDTISFLVEELRALEPIPIFIAPGNHDYYSIQSWYARERGMDVFGTPPGAFWPENIYIFREPAFKSHVHDLFTVTGIAHLGNDELRPPLEGLRPPEQGKVNFLMLHGSRRGFSIPEGKKMTFPFSDQELLTLGFDYVALGHYHTHSVIRDERSIPRAAYSGCPEPMGFDDEGEKGVILGEVRPQGEVSLEFRKICTRLYKTVTIPLDETLSHREKLIDHLKRSLQEECQEEDIVRVVIEGRRAKLLKLNPERDLPFLESMVFHWEVKDNSRPDYELEEIKKEESTRGRFVERLLEQYHQEEGEEKRRLLMDALYLGLDAFEGVELRP